MKDIGGKTFFSKSFGKNKIAKVYITNKTYKYYGKIF